MKNKDKRFLYKIAANSLAPLERLTVSQWAEKYRIIKSGAAKPGKWDNDYFPYQKHIMDAFHDNRFRGIVLIKSNQIGGSEISVNIIGWIFSQSPAPTLFLTSTDEQARMFSQDRFTYMINSATVLKKNFLLGRKHNETMCSKKSVSGRLTIAGSQSPNKLMSIPYKYVFCDEYDRLPYFQGIGDAKNLALQRMSSYPDGKAIFYSTPTGHDEGISVLYQEESTREEFHVPCPKCNMYQKLVWSQVVIPEGLPSKAFYQCVNPECKHKFSDYERYKACLKGKFVSDLSADEYLSRTYRGFHVSQLYSRIKKISDLARDYMSCKNEANYQVFHNCILGQPYTSNVQPITLDDLAGKRSESPFLPEDTLFLTCGIDVQGDKSGISPTFVIDVSAWTDRNIKYLVFFKKIIGWDALRSVLRDKIFKTASGKEFKISLSAIDSQYQQHFVYEFCRERSNQCVPIKYGAPEGVSIRHKPLIEYPGVNLYYLHREMWMEMVIGRMQVPVGDAGGAKLPPDITEEYFQHWRCLRLKSKTDARGIVKQFWEKETSYYHDDFVHCAIYAEFAMGLYAKAKNIDFFKLSSIAHGRNKLPPNVKIGGISKTTRRFGKIRI